MNEELTHLSLFSGIGGMDLAAEWSGFKTVGQCEFADYPTKVLEKNWPDVPRWRDIHELSADEFIRRTGLHPGQITVISGGFPCQPFSVAGKRRGKQDDRYLWPEMCRVIREIRPSWVVGENVAGIVNMALDTVISDLEAIGYAVQAFIIPACAVDAPHRRDRCAIVGYAEHDGLSSTEIGGEHFENAEKSKEREEQTEQFKGASIPGSDEALADTDNGSRNVWRNRKLCTASEAEREWGDYGERAPINGFGEWWSTEPDVGRVADGVSFRVDRLKCLGNAVVPQQFYPIFKMIAEIEKGLT